jgi:hypothetical protein
VNTTRSIIKVLKNTLQWTFTKILCWRLLRVLYMRFCILLFCWIVVSWTFIPHLSVSHKYNHLHCTKSWCNTKKMKGQKHSTKRRPRQTKTLTKVPSSTVFLTANTGFAQSRVKLFSKKLGHTPLKPRNPPHLINVK